MSHNEERKDKDCLNCGEIVLGRYCQHCGQENVKPDLTFLGLVRHFFYDVTHFDGKYFITLKYLFTRPGFLSREYIIGRRASYLDPARMYIFTSAIFFLLFYGFFLDLTEKKMTDEIFLTNEIVSDLSVLDTNANFNIVLGGRYILKDKDTVVKLANVKETLRFRDSIKAVIRSKNGLEKRPASLLQLYKIDSIKRRSQYDSLQAGLPKEQRDSWFNKQMAYRQLTIEEQYQGNTAAYFAHITDKFIHSFPTIFFLSLPLLAMVLKLMFLRRRQMTLAIHGIYLVHIYIFTFLWMIVYLGFDKLRVTFQWEFMQWVKALLYLVLLIYYYKAQRYFYKQGRVVTAVKLAGTLVLGSIAIFILSAVYFGIMAWKG